ncbi:hypothetical protein Tco_1165280 [Tanacetum coccineum]
MMGKRQNYTPTLVLGSGVDRDGTRTQLDQGSIPKDVIDTDEGLIPRGVEDVNTELIDAQERIGKCSHISSHSEAFPAQLLEKRHIYGPCIEETDRLAVEVHATIKDYVGLLRNKTDKLTQFLTTVKEMKKQLEVEMQTSNYDHNKEALYVDLLGVTVHEHVVINNPNKSSNKESKRRTRVAEEGKAIKKPRTTWKVPFKPRTCSKCGGKVHKRRKCTGKKVMPEDEVQEVDGVDEVAEEDEVQDVDGDYKSDEDSTCPLIKGTPGLNRRIRPSHFCLPLKPSHVANNTKCFACTDHTLYITHSLFAFVA